MGTDLVGHLLHWMWKVLKMCTPVWFSECRKFPKHCFVETWQDAVGAEREPDGAKAGGYRSPSERRKKQLVEFYLCFAPIELKMVR